MPKYTWIKTNKYGDKIYIIIYNHFNDNIKFNDYPTYFLIVNTKEESSTIYWPISNGINENEFFYPSSCIDKDKIVIMDQKVINDVKKLIYKYMIDIEFFPKDFIKDNRLLIEDNRYLDVEYIYKIFNELDNIYMSYM